MYNHTQRVVRHCLKTGKHFVQNAISRKGHNMNEIQLRPWQSEAIKKALHWLTQEQTDFRFLLNVAPGAGKTICACVIAKELLDRNEIERVVVIAPRTEVVRQWGREFESILGRQMTKVTGADSQITDYGIDICANWQSIANLEDGFQSLCSRYKTLVICDEYHHAAIEAAWGIGVNKSFVDAKYRILLSGTPVRTDGARTIAYDDEGIIEAPEEGTYSLTYGESVKEKYCRPATFHRHEGVFNVVLENDDKITVSSKEQAGISGGLKMIKGLQEALNFYKLACTPKYIGDGKTPDPKSYQASMLKAGIEKLNEAREIIPNAGGLVIARNILVADYMAELLESMGEQAVIVHSHIPNVDSRITAFKNNDKKWLVSVGMISEGVDIPRLRVLVYLPSSQTELTFRQSMGRVVRTFGHDDISSAYVVMPSILTFEEYASRVEEEMRVVGVDIEIKNLKVCPECNNQCPKKAKKCGACGYVFPKRSPSFKECSKCQAKNPLGRKTCQDCGNPFVTSHNFEISLKEAVRIGAIIRGMDLSEEEVQRGEEIGKYVKEKFLESGEEILVEIARTMPTEIFGRIEKIFTDVRQIKDID